MSSGLTLIPVLRDLLTKSIEGGKTQHAYLADPATQLIISDKSDKGWGCGYRNLQMMLSVVLDRTREGREWQRDYTVRKGNSQQRLSANACVASNGNGKSTSENQALHHHHHRLHHDIVGSNSSSSETIQTPPTSQNTELSSASSTPSTVEPSSTPSSSSTSGSPSPFKPSSTSEVEPTSLPHMKRKARDDGNSGTNAHAAACDKKIKTDETRHIIPSIPELQVQLEYAWQEGFDTTGAEQLGHRAQGTRTWIGTTECWSVLSSLGIRCKILDFHKPTGPNHSHPALWESIYQYFSAVEDFPVMEPDQQATDSTWRPPVKHGIFQTRKPPLYLQHQGHSRTVVGVEILASGECRVLMFDPSSYSLPGKLARLEKGIRTQSKMTSYFPPQAKVPPRVPMTTLSALTLHDAAELLLHFQWSLKEGLDKKLQYQLLGVAGLEPADVHDMIPASDYPRFLMQSEDASISIGWDRRERAQCMDVTSTRVPPGP